MNKSISKKPERGLSPRDAAYQRLMKAIKAIPGFSPRDQLRKFTAFALKIGVLNQMVEVCQRGVVPLTLSLDWTLLGKDVGGTEEWGREAGKAYGEAVAAFEPFECILGRLFNELVGTGRKKKDCQHFTPWAQATAIMRFLPAIPDAHKIGEICCGAGTLLLGRLHQVAKADPSALRDISVLANDRDPLCAALTALQLLSNQLIWRMPLSRVVVECKDIISQYWNTGRFFCLARFHGIRPKARAFSPHTRLCLSRFCSCCFRQVTSACSLPSQVQTIRKTAFPYPYC